MPNIPGPGEAAPYYSLYIEKAGGEDVLATLEAQLDEMDAYCSTISEEGSLHRYAPGKWSIREVLNHINDTERAFVFRALWFARGFTDPLPGYDQDIAAAGAKADHISWAAQVAEWRVIRASTIALFRNLPAEAWSARGIASGVEFTVNALAFITAGHVTHHLQILRDRYR
ncbi:MAG: DinB family protein [Bryobacteraceae bacterium]